MAKLVPRLLRADDFVAETYESLAAKLPPSQKSLAEHHLRTAKMFRESGRPGMVRVWEEERIEFVSNSLQDARVRLTVDGCISLLWPPDDYTGKVKEIRRLAGQTRLLIQFDRPTPSGQQTEEVPEHEVERVYDDEA
jgi:hypothetical protein